MISTQPDKTSLNWTSLLGNNMVKREIPKIVTNRELKSFAFTMSWAIPCLFTLFLPWIFDKGINWWPLVISTILMILYFTYPKGIFPIYRGWMTIASVLGWVNTRVILALIFYLIIFPIGILLRIFGKLQYRSSENPNQQSYWKLREIEMKKEDLERPF